MPCDRAPKSLLAGATVVDTSGGRAERRNGLASFGPTGVQEQGAGTRGSLGNLRDPAVSTDISGSGTGIPISPCPRPRAPVGGSKSGARVVSPNEGNEVRRDGRQGVGASHSSEEAGELDRRTPCSEGGAVLWTGSRNHAEGIEPPSVSPRGGRIVGGTANPQRDEPDASSTCTSGSAGGLGGKPPRPTRRKRPKAAETVPKSNGARRRSTCGSRLLFAGRGDLLLPISRPWPILLLG